jgi:hypothetical protein
MSLKCSYCSQENPDGSAFCKSCSRMLQQATGPHAAAQQPYPGGYPQQPQQPQQQQQYPAGYPQPQQQQPPHPGGYSQGLPAQQGSVYQGNTGMYSPPPPISVPVQMGKTTGRVKQLFARRAFAGRGTSITHFSWLLEGKQEKAEAIFVAARDLLMRRNQEILELKVESKALKDVGVRADQDEERLYIVLKRGVTTVFLYIAPVGRNLYISRTTTVLPLISLMRIGMLAIGVISTLVFFSTSSQGISLLQASSSILFTLLLIALSALVSFVFFWLPVIVLIIPSIFHAITEKDLWVYLRERSLTSFQVDDVMVLERLTDYILSVAVEQVGLNRDLIGLSEERYKPKQVVRGF